MSIIEPGGDPQSSESSSETNPVSDASVNFSCSLVCHIILLRRTFSKRSETNYIADDPDGLLPATLEQRSEGRITIIALEQR